MKKRIFSRVLALFMALSLLTTTVFAASFDDLQNAIDGTGGASFTRDDQDYLGYGDSLSNEQETKYEIETSKGENNSLDVTLNTDVKYDSTTDENSTITIGAGQDVNLDLNDNNITGTAGSDVIDVKGDLTITGGDEEGKNTISGGKTGINVEEKGTLALDSVTVTGNDIGIAFTPESFVTFIGDMNAVSGNKTKQISGDGKVTFKLDDQEYKVDAKTAETLLAGKDSVAAHGRDWILAKNDGSDTYTVVYTNPTRSNKIDNYAVKTAIENAAKEISCDISNITRFVVPTEVTDITGAFDHRNNLEKVDILGELTAIGPNTFTYCSKLKEINIPNSEKITSIGAYAFRGCHQLQKLDALESGCITSIGKYALSECGNLTGELKLSSQLTVVDEAAFIGCEGLRGDIVIPASLETLGAQAFEGCKGLTKLSFAEGCKLDTIAKGAFYKCKGLKTEVKIPASVINIEASAFGQCDGLESVEILGNIEVIADHAFSECPNLKTIKIPNTVKKIDVHGLSWGGLTGTFTLPEKLEEMGRYAFNKCENLTSIVFPSTLKSVAADAFKDSSVKSGILYRANDMTDAEIQTATQAIMAGLKCNIFVVDNGDLSFYRGAVSADFSHSSADASISKTDGSVALTNVSGTITGEREITLPDVAGITASIDTNGNITIEVPEGGGEYPYGATVTVNPDGSIDIEAHDAPPVELPEFTFDTTADDDGTTITDDEIPLAGLISRAQLVSYLYAHEGSPDGEDAGGEYTLAWAWAVENEIEDEENDPEEIVTGAILREVMTAYAGFLGTTFDVKIDVEDDVPVTNCDAILAEFYASLEAKAA